MGDEVTLLLEVFNKIEKVGGQATLSVATVGGKTKVKLEIATTPAPPASTSTSSSSVRRPRRRSARARARRNQRAAAHQAALAEAVTSAPLDQPPPRPLRLLPSPPPESGRRQVTAVARPEVPTFSTLNLDGPSPPTPPPPPAPTPPPPTPLSPFSLPPAPAPPYSMRPPLCYFNCFNEGQDHCYECGRCDSLCRDHYGCTCEREEDEDDGTNCAVCCCVSDVRYAIPKTPLPNRSVTYLL